MLAVQVKEYGGPERLEPATVDDPKPGPGELLVRTGAIGVNYIDTYQRSGHYAVPLPFVQLPPLQLGFLGQPTADGHDVHDGAFSALGAHHF